MSWRRTFCRRRATVPSRTESPTRTSMPPRTRRVDVDLQRDLAAVRAGERGAEALGLRSASSGTRDPDLGDQPLAAGGGEARELLERCLERPAPGAGHDDLDEADRSPPAPCRRAARGPGRACWRRAGPGRSATCGGPARARAGGRSGTARPRRRRARRRPRPHGARRWRRPSRRPGAGRPRSTTATPTRSVNDLERQRGQLGAQQVLGQATARVRARRRVGEGPAQRRLAVEQAGDGVQALADLVAPRAGGQRGDLLLEARQRVAERVPADPVHRHPAGCPQAAGLEVGQEPVDRAALARVVLEGLADDAAGEVDGERAHLAAELDEGLLALGRDLGGGGRDDAGGLLAGLDPRLLDDLGPLALRLGADAARLLARLGELLLVLLQQRLRLGAVLLGLGELALDATRALVQGGLAPWGARTSS